MLLDEGKFPELEQHLIKWQRADGKDPEVYIAWFNYYINRKMKTGMAIDASIDTKKPYMIITDPESGKVVGYLGDKVYYDYEDVMSAIGYLDAGLCLASNRLDMHFGKIHILGAIGEYEKQAAVVNQVLERAVKNRHQWLWNQNKSLPDGKQFLLDNVQHYHESWFQQKTKASMDAILAVSVKQIALFPDQMSGYNVLSYYYNIQNRKDEAMRVLLKAYSVKKDDYIIIGNIGMLYEDMKDKENARAFYAIMIKSTDPEISSWAKNRIKRVQ
jgi:tetratricopeptide (TPR) repeat protein